MPEITVNQVSVKELAQARTEVNEALEAVKKATQAISSIGENLLKLETEMKKKDADRQFVLSILNRLDRIEATQELVLKLLEGEGRLPFPQPPRPIFATHPSLSPRLGYEKGDEIV